MARPLHLIVVIPGIGGSVLSDTQVVWGLGLLPTLRLLQNPDRLDISNTLTPVSVIREKTLFPGWSVASQYSDLLRGIQAVFPGASVDGGNPQRADLNADVLMFPYDFRRSVVDSATRLSKTIEERMARRTEKKVLVVAHSMGGLIARYWLGPMGGWRSCRGLLTLGTPHRGAPKALDALVHGPVVHGVRLSRLGRVIRQWPSAYELLPRYKAIQESDGACRYPFELATQLGIDEAMAKQAFAVHEEIESAWTISIPTSPEGPEVVPFVGSGHATLESARWDGTTLAVSKARATWIPDDQLRGDGVVPGISAIPIERSGTPSGWRDVEYRHGPMAAASEVSRLLHHFETQGLGAVRGGEEARAEKGPRLGLDLEDSYAAGSPIRFGVAMRPRSTKEARLRAFATSEDPETNVAEGRPERTAAGWTVELAGLEPGFWQIRVCVEGVPVAPRPAEDWIAVVEK